MSTWRTARPKIVANLPLKNSVVGPPVNLDIDPTASVAIVANSMNAVQDGGTWKQVPDNKIYIIDLKAKPAKLINTIEGDKQPSGLSINPAGTLALVANRAGKSISVLSIHGTDVKLVGSVDMGDEVSAVVFTPDGKHALASKASANKVALLDVDGDTVTYNKKDIPDWAVSLQCRGGAERRHRARRRTTATTGPRTATSIPSASSI